MGCSGLRLGDTPRPVDKNKLEGQPRPQQNGGDMKAGGLDIADRHLNIGGQDSEIEEDQENASQSSGLWPKEPEAEDNFADPAQINQLPMKGQIAGHDADISVCAEEMQAPGDDHDHGEENTEKGKGKHGETL